MVVLVQTLADVNKTDCCVQWHCKDRIEPPVARMRRAVRIFPAEKAKRAFGEDHASDMFFAIHEIQEVRSPSIIRVSPALAQIVAQVGHAAHVIEGDDFRLVVEGEVLRLDGQ